MEDDDSLPPENLGLYCHQPRRQERYSRSTGIRSWFENGPAVFLRSHWSPQLPSTRGSDLAVNCLARRCQSRQQLIIHSFRFTETPTVLNIVSIVPNPSHDWMKSPATAIVLTASGIAKMARFISTNSSWPNCSIHQSGPWTATSPLKGSRSKQRQGILGYGALKRYG